MRHYHVREYRYRGKELSAAIFTEWREAKAHEKAILAQAQEAGKNTRHLSPHWVVINGNKIERNIAITYCDECTCIPAAIAELKTTSIAIKLVA